ncbi:DUF4114 domain-containing protein [Ulvibacterium sp.]|uniref:DUF4114 domain-containing protein n=1 Tax=Ulvibacterium sp. TaxID=2665914 RepID=UPI00261CA4E8|nr:DUF4114 domain-containing protein [Ulvibacterium sp.]
MKNFLLLMATLTLLGTGYGQDYNFLGEYTSDGTPKYFDEKDEVSQETLDLIADALPEGFPVPDYNPQYITSGYDTDIVIKETADVWVTFVGEGAGYKNVLGFYTYNTSNPSPEAPSPEEITIVFPNVSAKYSGGSLEVGHKVKLGRFAPGTSIGWVLLANGWKGRVTSGLWQLYSGTQYNPEREENLRYHNVLLNDPDNERIILGFEDIRRDYASCDQDFNDALFYITANPYTAIETTNYNKITDHAPVSSGNDGGLESNGDLARLIAKRNFDRNKTNSFKNTKKRQSKYDKKTYKSLGAKSGELDAYFPASGMFGTETTYVSSPEDLLNITNAENIFSIDYYEGSSRVSAALATETKGKVYNHTKTICDRLNDSQLLDVRTVTLQGHELAYSQLQRANGSVEYALTFSVKNEGGSQRLYSLWNLDAYPIGDYRNFQVWGNSMGQVTTLVNHILNTLSQQKELKTFKGTDILPTVFIKNGYYKAGKLHLNVVNKVGASWLNIDGNYKVSEQEREHNLNKMITLSGAWEEEVIVDTGYLFDIGISILAENSYQHDAMYLADGPWGADMNPNVDAIATFEIKEHTETIPKDGHSIERSVSAKGEVKETINIFRNLLAGDLQLYVTDYDFLRFHIQNDRPIEVSLVTDATDQWEERLRFTLEPNTEITAQSIALADFKNHEGKSMDFTQVKTIVFSVQGDYQTYAPFTLEIEDMALTTSGIPEEDEQEEEETYETVIITNFDSVESVWVDPIIEEVELKHYPNPFIAYTVVTLPAKTDRVAVSLTNLGGQMVYQDNLVTQHNNSAVRLEVPGLHPGMYVYTIMDIQNGRTYRGKLIKE